MRYWWARVGSDRYYGWWVPTGCTEKADAIIYMELYPGERRVQEWLLL
jgi:hypothetical protein